MDSANYTQTRTRRKKTEVAPTPTRSSLGNDSSRFYGNGIEVHHLNEAFNASMGLIGLADLMVDENIESEHVGARIINENLRYKLLIAAASLATYLNSSLDRAADAINERPSIEVSHG